MKEIAIVSATTNAYDYLQPYWYFDDRADYIFFTDGKAQPTGHQWMIEEFPEGVTDDPWKLAKIPKCNPHMIPRLLEYRYVIWLDGSMEVVYENFVDEILAHMGERGLLLSPHFDGRDCGYGEATIRPPKYANQPLDEQVAAYRAEGFPEHYGLYECGVQARDMSVPAVAEFGEIWLNEILKWTVQDQVSCGYSLWKSGLSPHILPKSWRDYPWLHINAHRREDPYDLKEVK